MNTHIARYPLFIAALLTLGACTTASAPPLEGTFAGIAVTPLPSPPLPMGDLTIDTTLRLNAATSTFELDTDLEAVGLTDVMDVRGTYVAANGMLTLTPTGFVIDPVTGNTQMVVGGTQCITLRGFAGTVVCLPEQTSEYTLVGSVLTFTLDDVVADVAGSVPMSLTRVP